MTDAFRRNFSLSAYTVFGLIAGFFSFWANVLAVRGTPGLTNWHWYHSAGFTLYIGVIFILMIGMGGLKNEPKPDMRRRLYNAATILGVNALCGAVGLIYFLIFGG